jgi:pyruvate dehydrogenase E2 component (dihydrolipoamide acetyltransferase)
MDSVVPDLGENITSATVVEIFVSVGDLIKEEQPILSLETDKAEFELPASVGGKISEILVAAGDDVVVGQAVLRVEGAASAGPSAPSAESEDTTSRQAAGPQPTAGVKPVLESGSSSFPTQSPFAGPVPAAPSVRRLARQLGIDIREVLATGEGGRISADDVHRYVRGRGGEAAHKGGSLVEGPSLPDFSKWGSVERVPMSKVRRRTAENMGQAWASIPHVTHHDKADITDLDVRRKQTSEGLVADAPKVTMTAVLLSVLGRALAEFPKFNSSVDMRDSSIVYKHYVHIGVAVDTDKGLLVPVVRDVDKKPVEELAAELLDLSARARGRNIRPDSLQGASFTLTNLGGIGGNAFSPLINPPEVAVLGVARGVREPLWIDGDFEPRLMLPLSLSYDHRVIDGADAARFVRWICEALEDASLLSGEGM